MEYKFTLQSLYEEVTLEKSLKEHVEDALGSCFEKEINKLIDYTYKDTIKFNAAYVQGWLKGIGILDKYTNKEIEEAVEEYIKKVLIKEIEKCIKTEDDPIAFRRWPIIKGTYF